MESIKTFAEMARQKDLIHHLLRTAYPSIPEEAYEDFTEMVFNKMVQQGAQRAALESNSDGSLETTAEQYGVTKDIVLDSFMYFNLLVENVWLATQIAELLAKEDLDK